MLLLLMMTMVSCCSLCIEIFLFNIDIHLFFLDVSPSSSSPVPVTEWPLEKLPNVGNGKWSLVCNVIEGDRLCELLCIVKGYKGGRCSENRQCICNNDGEE